MGAVFCCGSTLQRTSTQFYARSVLIFLVGIVAYAASVHAESRVALIVGNSAYRSVPPLTNTRNDAEDMAEALRSLGWTVIDGIDLDKQSTDRKIKEFSVALAGADAAVFFYAGHGLQVNGINYLVPIDAELSTSESLEFEVVKLEQVQRIMEDKTGTNILFLDACRNNPFARNLARALGTRSTAIGQGLAQAESGVGTLISFSTQPGNVALDGKGRNSPYAGPLVKAITSPGEDVLSILTSVRNDVRAATEKRQVPWESNSLLSKFYFNRGERTELVSPAAAAEAERAWVRVQNSTDIDMLEAFRSQFGAVSPFYNQMAVSRIASLSRVATASVSDAQAALTKTPTSPPSSNELVIQLKSGKVVVRLRPDLAPKHVERIKTLAAEGFYNGLKFHRVIEGFMAQTGDPTGTGNGSSKYGNLPAEFSAEPYKRGSIGAARSASPDSANSQIFVCFTDNGCSTLNGKYTLFGQVVSGMEYVDRIARGEPPGSPDVMQKVYVVAPAEPVVESDACATDNPPVACLFGKH